MYFLLLGHSVGELGCAYADGCFTAEQMILAAYYRGKASVDTPFIKGSMAAIGLGYNQVRTSNGDLDTSNINGPDSTTSSLPYFFLFTCFVSCEEFKIYCEK